MLNIASTPPVHWPNAPAPAATPVAAVSAVSSSPRAHSGDSQSGMGSDRESRAGVRSDRRSGQDPASELQAAPLLPRESGNSGHEAHLLKTREEVQDDAQKAEAAEEKAVAASQKLLEVLSTVWKASAAVVEGVLGLDKGGLNAAKAGGLPVEGQLPPAATESAPEVPMTLDEQLLLGRAAGDPVGYTEQGSSTWMPLETGQLVRERV